jgi:hypothetical protein
VLHQALRRVDSPFGIGTKAINPEAAKPPSIDLADALSAKKSFSFVCFR